MLLRLVIKETHLERVVVTEYKTSHIGGQRWAQQRRKSV
jgi:hypothetical protein